MSYLNSKGVKNVLPYVMVNSKKAATRVQNELGKVSEKAKKRGQACDLRFHPDVTSKSK